MIEQDNKLSRTRKTGYTKIIKKEPEEKKEPNPELFSYEDFPNDDFIFGKDIPMRKKDINFNIKINK